MAVALGPLKDRLLLAAHKERLGHALLLSFQSPIRAQDRAHLFELCQGLLCHELLNPSTGAPKACGRCASCLAFRQIQQDSATVPSAQHPDFLHMQGPIETHKFYSMSDAQELKNSMSLKKQVAPRRVALIEDAERLGGGGGAQGSAAHALLKLIEEPRPDTVLILCSSENLKVLSTIRSRTQSFRVLNPEVSSLESQIPEGYQELLDFLKEGAENNKSRAFPTHLPPSREVFWKQRAGAYDELKRLYIGLWHELKISGSFGSLGQQKALRVWTFMDGLEGLLAKLRQNAAGHLQWIRLESDARMGNYGRR